MMKPESITQLLQRVKGVIAPHFNDVVVEGEISNLSYSSAGHWYFTLSDESSSISCALFKMDAMRHPLIKQLKDGDKVWCYGPVDFYIKRGQLQLIAKKISLAGEGDLKARFEKLKATLAAEGLFDLSRKKAIPKYPQKIAVVTALQGAALQDFLNVYQRRSMWGEILIVPSLVQGDSAPASLIRALEMANNVPGIDLVVITRGGGSAEDLWAFNDEKLVRYLADYSIPTVSAVGHQVDFTLCDFVADLRCETPTAAAEILTQSQTMLVKQLSFLSERLKACLQKSYQTVANKVNDFHPHRVLDKLLNKQQFYHRKLLSLAFIQRSTELVPLRENQLFLDELIQRMVRAVEKKYGQLETDLVKKNDVLSALSPKNILERGYTMAMVGDKLVTSMLDFERLPDKAKLEIVFKDGTGNVQKL